MNNKQDSNNYKILAVENGTSIQDALKKMVRQSKYSLTEFTTLRSALKEIQENHFDILILDFSTITESKLNMLKNIREKDENVYIILLINSQKLTIPLKDLKALSVQGYCEKDDKLEQLPLFVEAAVKLYSGDKPLGLFADRLNKNLENMNSCYSQIKDIFENAGISDFAKLPREESERRKFVELFRKLNDFLQAAKIQGFVWNKLSYDFINPDTGIKYTIKVIFDEKTYNILVLRLR